jgi:two-component system response regulator FixJ
MSKTGKVYVVDDDDAIRDGLTLVLTTAGHEVRSWPNGDAFLRAAPSLAPGCALLDVRMPVIDGVELQRRLTALNLPIEVIILTGHADVPTAVRTLRAGAANFLEKPVETKLLLKAVGDALQALDPSGADPGIAQRAGEKVAALSPREREVLGGLAAGKQNKTIAIDLGISHRTVEVYRANIMEKLEASNLSEVLYIAFACDLLKSDAA